MCSIVFRSQSSNSPTNKLTNPSNSSALAQLIDWDNVHFFSKGPEKKINNFTDGF